ncbi:hypothetical protein [Micromonospora cathayae]|uniref:Uncharacterized protein n=1 Tax=Micromonospora cathayae TaxID=3028804 RepID=A0ABY7ZXJ8_9ACTN|nr:hypothetical protein [Micromonospora sp. HUAS 3]WDZ87168.1 hypothetical protein PVK37_12570 [Micromonospora sp. HUAS 3]
MGQFSRLRKGNLDLTIGRMVLDNEAKQDQAAALEREATRIERQASAFNPLDDADRAEIADLRARAAKLRGR